MEIYHQARIGVKVEVSNNVSRDHSKTHPADILFPNWFRLGRTAALDVSITPPLNSSTQLDAGVLATATAQATESRNHQSNDPDKMAVVCMWFVVLVVGVFRIHRVYRTAVGGVAAATASMPDVSLVRALKRSRVCKDCLPSKHGCCHNYTTSITASSNGVYK